MSGNNVQAGIPAPVWAAGLYAAMDAGDIDGFVSHLSEDVSLRSGNADPIIGRENARAASIQLYGAIGGMKHHFKEVWENGDSVMLVADAEYTRLDGSIVSLPCVTHVHHRADGLVDSMHVFMDISPVFAAETPVFMESEPEIVESANVALVKRFYSIADGKIAGDPTELFTDDVEIYAPKFGSAFGLEAMKAAGAGRSRFSRMIHHIDEFSVIEHGNRVIIEGTTEGETATGRTWDGHSSVSGRFCGVYDIRDGQISRMCVYFDPDLGNEDADRYPYHKAEAQPVAS